MNPITSQDAYFKGNHLVVLLYTLLFVVASIEEHTDEQNPSLNPNFFKTQKMNILYFPAEDSE